MTRVFILPRLVSVEIDRRVEHKMQVDGRYIRQSDAMIEQSARLPLPNGWRFWSLLYNPMTSSNVAIIEHDVFPQTIDGEVIPKWPVFSSRALAHLTLCGGTRLDA